MSRSRTICNFINGFYRCLLYFLDHIAMTNIEYNQVVVVAFEIAEVADATSWSHRESENASAVSQRCHRTHRCVPVVLDHQEPPESVPATIIWRYGGTLGTTREFALLVISVGLISGMHCNSEHI